MKKFKFILFCLFFLISFYITGSKILNTSLINYLIYNEEQISSMKYNNMLKEISKSIVNDVVKETTILDNNIIINKNNSSFVNLIKKDDYKVYIYNTHDEESYSNKGFELYNTTPTVKLASYMLKDELKNLGIKKTIMLTGDKESISKNVFEKLNIDKYYSELLPQDKVNIIDKLKMEKSKDGKIVFAGDGINDAPVIVSADIGISMGGVGSDAAIEASDIVIMTDELSKISTVINISKRTMKIVRQNIIFALSVKIFGLLTMWSAVFADVGVSVLAILNSIRILKIKY